MRDAFGRALVELGEERPDLVVLDADVGHPTRSYLFQERFPERFVQAGVAEQNMLGIAAGLASTGWTPVVTGFACFMTRRSCDQLALSIAYPRLNVKLVGCYSGFTTPNTGATHQAFEDIAIVRAIPNISVVVPGDELELRQALQSIIKAPGPAYLRVARSSMGRVVPDAYQFGLGAVTELRDGEDLCLVGTGIMTSACLEASRILARQGIRARVLHAPSLKPMEPELIVKAARETGRLVTVENHRTVGGLGSCVSEILTTHAPAYLTRLGVGERFGESGRLEELIEELGLSAAQVASACTAAAL